MRQKQTSEAALKSLVRRLKPATVKTDANCRLDWRAASCIPHFTVEFEVCRQCVPSVREPEDRPPPVNKGFSIIL